MTDTSAGATGAGAAGPVRSGRVPPLTDGFVARPESVPALELALLPGAVVALVPAARPAFGGTSANQPDWSASCGKSQLAVHLAESLWSAGEVDLLLWIVAADRASILAGLAAGATDTAGLALSGSADSLVSRFLGWLSETDRRWLAVIDGLRDVRDIDGLLPSGPAGRTLITAAARSAVPPDARIVTLPVPGLSRREGLTYLMGRLTADPAQRLGAIDLIDEVKGEPLALALATSVILSTEQNCQEYLDLYTARQDRARHPGGPMPPLAETAWALAIELADQLHPGGAVRSMLVLLALFDGAWIPAPILTSVPVQEHLRRNCGVTTAEQTQAVLAVLVRAGLVTIDPAAGPPVVRMNRAVRAAIRAAAPAAAFEQLAPVAAGALREIWPDPEPAPWPGASLRAATFAIMRQAGDRLWDTGCPALLLRAGQSLDRARLDDDAIAYWTELAAISHRVLGPAHPDSLQINDHLAESLLLCGRAGPAVDWFRKMAVDRLALFGAGHPGSIDADLNLGRALRAAGRAEEAIEVLGRAVTDCELLRGPGHAQTLRARGDLADATRVAQPPARVTRLFQRLLTDCERILGPAHPQTMDTRAKLADLYLAQEKFKDAEAQYRRLLADREQVQGTDHPQTITARSGLAAAQHAAGRMALALRLFEQADADARRVLGADHVETLTQNVNLALLYTAVGRLTDAVALLEETISRCERVLPADDPLTAAARQRLDRILDR